MTDPTHRGTHPAKSPKNKKANQTLIFCKPYKVMSCFTDPDDRATLGDYVDIRGVFAAGRLDYHSEGLLILTSDGRLAHRITHPRYKLKKEYLVQVENIPGDATLHQLRQGVMIKGRQTLLAEVELLPDEPQPFARSEPVRYRKSVPTSWLRIKIREGRNRQIRRMTAAVGYPTLRLIRIAIGPITLGDLMPGQWRTLTGEELQTLWSSLG